MNKKLLLAEIRAGDYTHAGDKEAIEIVMSKIKKDPHRQLLDVGCGLGGTAAYLHKMGWGKVTGIDIDKNAIIHAIKQYPDTKFLHYAAEKIDAVFKNEFNIVYLFNSYYCFGHQLECLKIFANVSKEKGLLVLFDYSSSTQYQGGNPFHEDRDKLFNPINLKAAPKDFLKSGWLITDIIDLTDNYIVWYQQTITNLKANRETLSNKFGETAYNLVINGFMNILNLLESKKINGSILYAIKR